MLQSIPEEEWRNARRLFQCLIAAVHPLRVEELAELFAMQFDLEVGPNVVEGWRPEDPKDALLLIRV
jgi:hypothetical protein